jgi:hypothetical protein
MVTPITWDLPFGTGRAERVEDAQSIFSAKISEPNHLYTYFYAKRTNL